MSQSGHDIDNTAVFPKMKKMTKYITTHNYNV